MRNVLFTTTELQNTKTYAPDMFSFIRTNSVIGNDNHDYAPANLIEGHKWESIGRLRCRTQILNRHEIYKNTPNRLKENPTGDFLLEKIIVQKTN